jgi:hypothetical protein
LALPPGPRRVCFSFLPAEERGQPELYIHRRVNIIMGSRRFHFHTIGGDAMATTAIFPIHAGKGRSVAKAIRDVTDYMENPLKTEGGELVSSFGCAPESAETEFLLAKSRYHALTGRSQKSDVIAYHARQSFKPGEIAKEEANRLGYELALRFTKGRNSFLVYTHTDRHHIHNHLVWNSTALDCKRKFRNFIGSAFALRRCSDILCAENALSVIQDPKPSPGRDYGRYMGRPPSFRDRVRAAVDAALSQSPQTFEDFLSLLREAGCKASTQRKHITVLVPDEDGLPKQKQPTRLDTLGGDYTEAAIRERIEGRRVVSAPAGKAIAPGMKRRTSLLIDIETKMREGKGAGYERWARIHNIKQMARTLIFLQEHGLDDYAALKEKAAAATAGFNNLSDTIKALDERLAANAALQKHIVTYAKTRQTYVDYRKAGYSKRFRELHEADILLHQTAKKAFDELGIKKLPTVASLRTEYASALDEKRKAYAEYRAAREQMKELLIAKTNVDRLLNLTDERTRRETERGER